MNGNLLESIVEKHLFYCRSHDWCGYDPYDALNSRLFEILPILDFRISRIALTQLLRRSPYNLRSPLLIPRKTNSKALALFLMAFSKLGKFGFFNTEIDIDPMLERLIALRSPNVPYWCWGYCFPWQTRTILVPYNAPNLVCTTFVATALMDIYELRQDPRCLNMAASAAEYILNELYWSDGKSCGFSYPQPLIQAHVHNANFLASALLCRIHKHTGDNCLIEPALAVARYSAGMQKSDGSWFYGEAPTQRWIDNFHTGYNLCALSEINRHLKTDEFAANIRKGFDFYKDHFICKNGIVKYFHDRVYPIDAHCIAQSILTLLTLNDLDLANEERARSVFQWAMRNLWSDSGFFYFQRHSFWTNRISFMRWTQAWMFLALSMLLCQNKVSVLHQKVDYLARP
jgi:hypothetical protein